MNVRELIAELQKHDPAMMVVVDGYEGGLTELKVAREAGIEMGIANPEYSGLFGEHEENEKSPIKAVYLPRHD